MKKLKLKMALIGCKKFGRQLKNFIAIFFFAFAQLENGFAHEQKCPVDIIVLEKSVGVLEIGLRNNTQFPYEIRYDQLPWVLGGSGVDFDIFIDGKKIQKASGAGHNSVVLNFGPNSYVFSVVDIGYLGSFYSGIEKDRVSIFWSYPVPGDFIYGACKFKSGRVSVP